MKTLHGIYQREGYSCGVMNCGNGRCVHKLTDELCPLCGMNMVKVTTTGFRFCSNHTSVCDYEIDAQQGAS